MRQSLIFEHSGSDDFGLTLQSHVLVGVFANNRVIHHFKIRKLFGGSVIKVKLRSSYIIIIHF